MPQLAQQGLQGVSAEVHVRAALQHQVTIQHAVLDGPGRQQLRGPSREHKKKEAGAKSGAREEMGAKSGAQEEREATRSRGVGDGPGRQQLSVLIVEPSRAL